MANAETDLQQRIRLALGTRSDARIFRNQVGSLPDPRTGRLVTFGLARGSADLIGWRTITITPDMIGTQLAVFTSIEVKTPTGRLTPEQRNWLHTVDHAGGIAGVARSVTDAVSIVTSAC
ncbi:MAG: VRR-NUC domain-containing protein [Cyanobacteria bacterium K_DeepCast_35m_m2_023]|nr:VRR-NUC domain-containing protein [Cyanobacteria bacterium K_DeepCast_35m_m2_023]